MIQSLRIHAAVVVYAPEIAILAKLLTSLAPQVQHVLLVANDGAPWSCRLPQNATIVTPEKNLGLGAAYNLAAARAREHGATHLLLLDQDSVPEPGMVAALAKVFTPLESVAADQNCEPAPSLRHSGVGAVAAAGPVWRDRRTSDDGFFIRFTWWGRQTLKPPESETVAVDFLISSGSLISLDALAEIGPFDEKLFIEHVDTDFALRAAAKGYKMYGVAGARLDHAFGEATMTASPLGMRRRFFLYPPARNYYLLRNSILLWRRPYAPWRWVWHDVRRTILMMLFYALFVPPRWARLKEMAQAIRDACRQNHTS